MPERGTLVIAALLLLAIGFTGVWIVDYVRPDSDPWRLIPYFVGAAAAIVVIGMVAGIVGDRRRRR